MAWLELHQELPRHPKTDILMDVLGVSRATAVGHIAMSWLWALEFATEGFISEKRAIAAARGSDWNGPAGEFAEAMVTAGWWDVVEGGYRVHDWEVYIGRLLAKRQADADRKAKERGATKGVRGTSAGHPRDGAGKPTMTVTNHGSPPTPPGGTEGEDFNPWGAHPRWAPEHLALLEAAVVGTIYEPERLAIRLGGLIHKAVEAEEFPPRVREAWYAMPPAQLAAWCSKAMTIAKDAKVQAVRWPEYAAKVIARRLDAGTDLLADEPKTDNKVVQHPSARQPKEMWEAWVDDLGSMSDDEKAAVIVSKIHRIFKVEVAAAEQARKMCREQGITATARFLFDAKDEALKRQGVAHG